MYRLANAKPQVLDTTITFLFFTAGSLSGGDPDFGDLAAFSGR
jgi:hypothetical protein